MDVANDGTGIETAGWFRSTRDNDPIDTESMIMSRLCALHWVIVLYENVVPDPLKADVSCLHVRHLFRLLLHGCQLTRVPFSFFLPCGRSMLENSSLQLFIS